MPLKWEKNERWELTRNGDPIAFIQKTQNGWGCAVSGREIMFERTFQAEAMSFVSKAWDCPLYVRKCLWEPKNSLFRYVGFLEGHKIAVTEDWMWAHIGASITESPDFEGLINKLEL